MDFESKIDLHQFCDLHGVSTTDKFVLRKKWGTQILSLGEWYKLILPHFNVKQKFFAKVPPPPVIEETVVIESDPIEEVTEDDVDTETKEETPVVQNKKKRN